MVRSSAVTPTSSASHGKGEFPKVSDFTWSHDGTQALIAYRDGFVLVGSVSGQRHWSSEINLESQITCGIWTPDDQQVLFGTADGQVIVMDCHGRMLAHVLLHESDGIVSMSWNCPNFLVEDSTESDTDSDDPTPAQVQNLKPLLTVSFISGDISLMNNYDDLSPNIIRSGLKDVEVQWCSQGDLLAVAGMERHGLPADSACASLMRNALRPITTICWGHRDSRLFLACGPALYVVRVEHRVASLQLLCQQGIASALKEERDVGKLNMPSLLCSYVTTAFIPTIKPPIPDPNNIRDFVSYPTAGNERLHCTMKRSEENPEAGGPCYTLYLEHLGGLVPILKGRRISKLRPEFVIMDPKMDGKADEVCVNGMISYMTDSCNCSDSSDIELSDEWVGRKSPKLSRGNRSPKLPSHCSSNTCNISSNCKHNSTNNNCSSSINNCNSSINNCNSSINNNCNSSINSNCNSSINNCNSSINNYSSSINSSCNNTNSNCISSNCNSSNCNSSNNRFSSKFSSINNNKFINSINNNSNSSSISCSCSMSKCSSNNNRCNNSSNKFDSKYRK
ncbi:tubby-related 4-like protein [Labeo rohita]|uniref:Tubby-related 4-like protein n=1 Tax=Labeo rohita TaxID=84645 RepID=A0A498MM57_LABRO|nr:tubby-related 4-like protein [Labeo rohita]